MLYNFAVRHLSPDASRHEHQTKMEKKQCSVAPDHSKVLNCIFSYCPVKMLNERDP